MFHGLNHLVFLGHLVYFHVFHYYLLVASLSRTALSKFFKYISYRHKNFNVCNIKMLNQRCILVNGHVIYQTAQEKTSCILLDSAFSLILPHQPILQTLLTLQPDDLLPLSFLLHFHSRIWHAGPSQCLLILLT